MPPKVQAVLGSPRTVEIIRNAAVVYGGAGIKDTPWVPTIEVFGDREFVVVDRGSRDFARCIVSRRVVKVASAVASLQGSSATACRRGTR